VGSLGGVWWGGVGGLCLAVAKEEEEEEEEERKGAKIRVFIFCVPFLLRGSWPPCSTVHISHHLLVLSITRSDHKKKSHAY
jgi:hypothetical protein